ncbi:MAG: glycosyltransferase, partial [Thermoproteota archaeon]
MLPKVTIGLCVKNNESTIHFTINSILRINYPTELLDLVVVDGKSRDKTLEIIKQALRNSNLSFNIFSDEGKGLAYARQLAVDNAKGEFIQWIDGDHVIPKDFITKQVKFIMSNDKLGAVEAITKHIGKSWVSKLEG